MEDENLEKSPVYIVKQVIKQLPADLGKCVMSLLEHPELSLRIHMAPAHASRSWNYAYTGGLLQSIADRCQLAEQLALFTAGHGTVGPLTLKQQLLTCVLLQDLFCVGDVFGLPHFIPNILKSGKVSVAEPFAVNPDCHQYQISGNETTSNNMACAYLLSTSRSIREDGDLSMALVCAYGGDLIKHLPLEMVLAIRCRHGLYGKNSHLMRGKETPLLIALNFLNLWSSRIARENVKELNEPAMVVNTKIQI